MCLRGENDSHRFGHNFPYIYKKSGRMMISQGSRRIRFNTVRPFPRRGPLEGRTCLAVIQADKREGGGGKVHKERGGTQRDANEKAV